MSEATVSEWRPGKEGLLKAERFLARGGVPRTPDARTSENSPSTHSDEYQALGVEESKLNSMPILGMRARDIVG